jgi:FkbM family methyltransferase
MRTVGGSIVGRSLLRAAASTPLVRAKGREGATFRLAKRLRYAPEAGFIYHRKDCAAVDLRLAGAALYLYYFGEYEPEALGPVAVLAKHAQTFLDIGSQVGVYSMVVAAANPDIHVFAFEADPTSVANLLENVRRNAWRPGIGSVKVCAAAVDDSPGVAGFHLAGGNSSLNSKFRPDTEELLCPKVSIDVFLNEVGHSRPIDLVKIDTESTEPAVLRGMRRTIERWRPVIALEVLRGRTEAELDRFLVETGYRPLWLRSDGPRAVEAVVGDPTHMDLNYLFVPNEKYLDVCSLLGLAQSPPVTTPTAQSPG